MELSGSGDNYQRAFAGDTYNTAVYAKRCQAELNVQMLTAVGEDPVSAAMLAQWRRDGVGHDMVMTSTHAHPGIYAIATDDQGERSFTYWRKDSAATELVSLLSSVIKEQAAKFGMVFFSGITLAILSETDKTELLGWLGRLKENGSRIALDPNYRAALWDSSDHAAHWLTQAYELVDIALPGLFDHQSVFGQKTEDDVYRFLTACNVSEVVLKAGAAGIFVYADHQLITHRRIEQHQAVDTTGAGDAFAGTYLAQRLVGMQPTDALDNAASVAGLVVQHKGAIVDERTYREFLVATTKTKVGH